MEPNAPRRNAADTLARHCERLTPLLTLPLTAGRRVTPAEACIRLGISRTTLWRKQRAGELPRVITTDVIARALGIPGTARTPVHDGTRQRAGA